MSNEIAVVDDIAVDRYNLITDICAWLRKKDRADDISVRGFPDGISFLHNGGLSGRISIVFLDICMDSLDGIETAERLRGGRSDSLIVFVTTAREYALAAYPVHPFDYLVKPYDLKRLDQVLSDALGMDANVRSGGIMIFCVVFSALSGYYFPMLGGFFGLLIGAAQGTLSARAMLDTRGTFWPWAIHFVQAFVMMAFTVVTA